MFVNLFKKKVAIYTLGCKVNQYESDGIAESLSHEGCELVPFREHADIYIINTCAVTNMAERKSRQIISRARKKNSNAVIAAAGCYVQSEKDKLKDFLKVDVLVGNNRKKDIARILDEYIGKHSVNDNLIDINSTCEYENMEVTKPSEHCRAYVKVQDGCNNFCSYCIIPYTRGRIRSRALEDVVSEVTKLASGGIKEVVITGINLSSYSVDGGVGLLELLQRISEIDGIERIRMGSLEPRIITDDFLKAISSDSKICPHFHLSLQSACDDTLKRMNRKYTIGTYADKCDMIRRYYDRPAITTDVIVGFPGETDEEFATTVDNLEALNLYEMHIFKYSKRNGTVAASMPNQVDDVTKEKRSNILLDMAARHKDDFERSFDKSVVPVLVEEYEEADGELYIKGHTDRYIMVRKKADKKFCEDSVNKIINIEYEHN